PFSSSSALPASAAAWEPLAGPEARPESRQGLWSSPESSPDFGERYRDCRPSSDAAAPWPPEQRRVDRFPPIRYDVIAAKSPIDPPGENLRARRSDCRRYENVPTGWHPASAPPAIDKSREPKNDRSLGRSLARCVRDVGRHGGRFPWRVGPSKPAPTCRRSPRAGSIRRAPGYYRAANRRAQPSRLRGGERVPPILPAMPRGRPDRRDASQCDCAEGRPWPIAF